MSEAIREKFGKMLDRFLEIIRLLTPVIVMACCLNIVYEFWQPSPTRLVFAVLSAWLLGTYCQDWWGGGRQNG